MDTKLVITTGDTRTIPFDVVLETWDDIAGKYVETPFDITGWVVFMTVKRRKTDSDAQALFQVRGVVLDGPGGKAAINILHDTTKDQPAGQYFYDFQISNPADNPPKVKTVVSDTITLLQGITDSIE